MGMTTLFQIGIVPAVLITLGGLLVLGRQAGESEDDEKAQRSFTLYLLAVAGFLLLALAVAALTLLMGNVRPFWQVASVLLSSVIGVLALLLLRARRFAAMGRAAKVLALLILLGVAGMVVAGLLGLLGVTTFGLVGVAVLVVSWPLGRRVTRTAGLFAVLLLPARSGLNSLFSMPPGGGTPFFDALGGVFSLLVLPGLVVVWAAVLLTNSLHVSGGGASGRRGLLSILLALALLGYLAYSIFWATVWDQTSDGLGGIFLLMGAAPVAVGAGMVMTVALNGRRRPVGLLFAILVPLLLHLSFARGWDVSYHAITEARAERVAQAVEEYRQREGVYPERLDALTPRYLLRTPQPVELQGETWCYQGGDDFFRLGAFSREYFSTPVELRVFQSAGEPDSVWSCEERLLEVKERYDW